MCSLRLASRNVYIFKSLAAGLFHVFAIYKPGYYSEIGSQMAFINGAYRAYRVHLDNEFHFRVQFHHII